MSCGKGVFTLISMIFEKTHVPVCDSEVEVEVGVNACVTIERGKPHVDVQRFQDENVLFCVYMFIDV